jgi:NAD dependent epimerase/dehydratase family enzyme
MKPRIVLAGGSAFIGQSLSPFLISKNYEVIVLTRAESDQRGAVRNAHWDGKTLGDWIQFLNGAAVVVNLTGRSINCRNTPENRHEIIDSRVDSVRVLGRAIEQCAHPPQVFVQIAGVGIYGDKGERICGDTTAPATISWPRGHQCRIHARIASGAASAMESAHCGIRRPHRLVVDGNRS